MTQEVDQRTLQSLNKTETWTVQESGQAERGTTICLKTQAGPTTRIDAMAEMAGLEATGTDAMEEMDGTAAREKGPGKEITETTGTAIEGEMTTETGREITKSETVQETSIEGARQAQVNHRRILPEKVADKEEARIDN